MYFTNWTPEFLFFFSMVIWLLIFKTHVRKSRSHFFSVTFSQSSTVTTAGVLDHFKNNLSTNTTFNILTQVYTGCFGCIWWGFFFKILHRSYHHTNEDDRTGEGWGTVIGCRMFKREESVSLSIYV